MKNSLKLALTLTTLVGGISMAQAAGGQQTADEAHRRLSDIAQTMREKGISVTFGLLNGHSEGGTLSGKGNTAEDKDHAEGMTSDYSEGGVICVHHDGTDWKYAVHQLRPMLIGQSAVAGGNIWRDDVGIAMVDKITKEMGGQRKDIVSVDYVDTHKRVGDPRQGKPIEEKMELLAVNKNWLLAGEKAHSDWEHYRELICAIRYTQDEPTDEGDYDRLTAPDRPHAKAKAVVHKKRVVKKKKKPCPEDEKKKEDAKKQESGKVEGKKEEPKKEEPKKEEPKKEEPKKEEAKVETKKEEKK